MKWLETDVIVIGGGAAGTGILRDAVLRGLRAVCIEKNDLASGTTGRNHGLLHSGARYAVKDLESARECIGENLILKRIARHCVEDTGGLFVALPQDDPDYYDRLLAGCAKAGILCREMGKAEALRLEPNLNPGITRAIHVPDATIDPFRFASSTILGAVEKGALVFTHTEAASLIRDQDRIVGVLCMDRKNGETFEVYGQMVVNASGIWGRRVCETAGITLNMFPDKGSLVIIDYRINNVVVNRCRPPSDGDIFVPGDTVSLIGTTSREIPYEEIENLVVDDDEIDVLLSEGEKLIPNVSKTRILRAYSGVRPLVALSEETDGRNISRKIVVVDHEERDGALGLITVAGGKLMTSRLMAEMVTDLVCTKLHVKKECITHTTPLPGSEREIPEKKAVKYFTGIANSVVGSTHYRHGERVRQILNRDPRNYRLICECEMVTEGEISYALKNLHVRDLIDLRRRTRLGMGPCQGELCAYRAAGLMRRFGKADGAGATAMLGDFLEERFKGIKPVLWGDGLREIEFTYWIYEGLFGLGNLRRSGIPPGESLPAKETAT